MLSDIIKNILTIDKRNLKENIRPMISELKERLNSNFDLLEEANNVDISKNNGFKLDLNIINNIFANVLKEPFTYGDITVSFKDDEKKIIYGCALTSCNTDIVHYINAKQRYYLSTAKNTQINANRAAIRNALREPPKYINNNNKQVNKKKT